MLIFVILLHFGLKILNVSAAKTDSVGTHICADFNKTTGTTTVRWAVSSNTPISVSDCELFYSKEGSLDPAQVLYNLASHGSRDIPTSLGLWTIKVTCFLSTSSSYPSPYIRINTDNTSSFHICSDSGLGNISPDSRDLVLCIWRPESTLNYASLRWQPSSQYASTDCILHQEVKGQGTELLNLPSDDMLIIVLGERDKLSAWVTCGDQTGHMVSSAKAHSVPGDSNVCSVENHSISPSIPDISDGQPTIDSPHHARIGISNMAMGLSLAGAILIAAIIITIVFVRWFRWQRRRRRERLIRHGEPASDQSAMDEFQQMM